MWNIFYHFYITDADTALLQVQLSKLIEESVDLKVWSSSTYGSSICYINQETLDRTREIWSRYLEVANLKPDTQRDELETKFKSGIDATTKEHHFMKNDVGEDDRRLHVHGLRSAGVNWRNALETIIIAFGGFWEYGVIGGNSQDVEALARHGRRVNPLMAISSAGDTFAVAHSSDPILGFNLASAFDDDNASEQERKESAVMLAKSQFREWCMVFGRKVREEAILIRVYCGDALRFCYELQDLRNPEKSRTNILRLYASAWHSTPIVLDNFDTSSDLHAFDIIDTNNLADPLGILNLLPAISPLLSQKATSTMFTETLSKYTKDPADIISHILCSDTTAMSLLLGLAPSGHLFGFTADAIMGLDGMRQLTIHADDCVSFHMRISWIYPNLEDPVGGEIVFQPLELANFFFKLYLKMFGSETSPPDAGRIADCQKYNRLSFAALVCLAQRCIKPDDWSIFGVSLFQYVQSDNTLRYSRSQLFELSSHFYHLGILSELPVWKVRQEIIRANQKDFKNRWSNSSHGKSAVHLLGREDVPAVVWITLSVSRERLGSFKTRSKSRTTVALQVKIWSIERKSETHFVSLQCFFGSLVQSSTDKDTYDALEDKSGWKGSSNLIVTCAVPSLLLLSDSIDSTRVELAVLDTGSGVEPSGPREGRRLAICCYKLDDDDVLVLKNPPGVRLQFAVKKSADTQPIPQISKQPCYVQMKDDSSIATMEIQNSFDSLDIQMATAARQVSPCAISDRVKGIEVDRFQLPYPFALHKATVDSSKKIRTLSVIPSSGLDDAGYSLTPFPVVLHGSEAYSLNIPKVNLDQQSIISNIGPNAVLWVMSVLGNMQSARERKCIDEAGNSTRNNIPALTTARRCFCTIAKSFVDPSRSGRKQTFPVKVDGRDDVNMIIFVSKLRHNIDQSSIVLDAYVLPYKAGANPLSSAIDKLLAHEDTQPISLTLKEADAFFIRAMLPAAVEACRNGWSHGISCEYRRYSSVSLYTESSDSPICSCGNGKDSEGFPRIEGWEILRKHATRMALMPLSSVPYVEVQFSKEERALARPRPRLSSTPEGTLEGIVQDLHSLQIVDPFTDGDLNGCKKCGKIPPAGVEHKTCGRCKRVRYCGPVCQKVDWKEHKKVCKGPAFIT